jgi:hypothetical protein
MHNDVKTLPDEPHYPAAHGLHLLRADCPGTTAVSSN